MSNMPPLPNRRWLPVRAASDLWGRVAGTARGPHRASKYHPDHLDLDAELRGDRLVAGALLPGEAVSRTLDLGEPVAPGIGQEDEQVRWLNTELRANRIERGAGRTAKALVEECNLPGVREIDVFFEKRKGAVALEEMDGREPFVKVICRLRSRQAKIVGVEQLRVLRHPLLSEWIGPHITNCLGAVHDGLGWVDHGVHLLVLTNGRVSAARVCPESNRNGGSTFNIAPPGLGLWIRGSGRCPG